MLQRTDVHLHTYTVEKINIMQINISVSVQYVNEEHSLDLLVVEEDGPSLKGCDWLSNLKRNQSVFYAGTKGAIELFHRHADLFKEELVSESG